MLYLDTSALLKLYVREEGSAEVQGWLEGQGDPLPVWEVQEMELRNALYLKVFRGELTAEQAEEQEGHFERRMARGLYYRPEIRRPALLVEFRRWARQTATLGCRTLDLLHVVCALQLEVEAFLTFDERQRLLAEEAGLVVKP